MHRFRHLLLGSIALVALLPAAAHATDSETAELRAQLRAALERVDQLERRVGTLEQQAMPARAAALSDASQAELRGMGVAPAGAPQDAGTAVADAEPDRKAPAPTAAVEEVASAQTGHYGSKLSLELGFNYSRVSAAQLNLSGFLALDSIALGTISVDETNADVMTTDATLRWGATSRLQFDVNVPYLWRRSNFQSGGAGGNASALTEKDITDNGIGDVSFGMNWRAIPESYRRPDVVIAARVKAPTGRHPFGIKLTEVEGSDQNLFVPDRLSTGTGTWGLSGSVSVLKTIDPLVVFANFTYFHNFSGHFDDLSEVPLNPDNGPRPGRAKFGDAIQFGAGIAFALNDRSSISTSFTERIVSRSWVQFDGFGRQKVVGSQANIGVLNLGATFSLSDTVALISNIGVGLTPDAPDMTLGLRLPIRF